MHGFYIKKTENAFPNRKFQYFINNDCFSNMWNFYAKSRQHATLSVQYIFSTLVEHRNTDKTSHPYTEEHSEPCQAFKMEHFAKLVNDLTAKSR